MNIERMPWVLSSMTFLVATLFIWKKYIVDPKNIENTLSKTNKITFSFISIIIILIFNRGFIIEGRSISLIDAYSFGNEKQASLVMNGAYSAIHNTRRAKENASLTYYSKEEFEEIKKEININFQRSIPSYYSENEKYRDIIILLLESWSVNYIDGLAGTNYGATPYMDSLLNKSSIWVNAYAAGQRSIEGIQAILTSIPLLEGQQTIGWGLEQYRMTTLAKEANSLGYHSVFMQTSDRRSFHMDSISRSLGFNKYYSKENFPSIREYPEKTPQFGWDYDGLMFFSNYLKENEVSKTPTFSFFFTGTTHEPFPNPGSEFHIRKHDNNLDSIDKYLNTLRYSDWSLEQFMESMMKHPRYQNTVFIFIADHVLRASASSKIDSFRIPLVIYTPDGSIPSKKHHDFASQYDILPTVAALLGIKNEISTFGRSLLTEPPFENQGVISKQGPFNVWFQPNGWSIFNASTGDISESSLQEIDDIKNIKIRLQEADLLLNKNKWNIAHN